MKRLIAKRPIQYMGRTYDIGEALPAYDSTMVAAWLAAGSAEWAEAVEPSAALSPDTQAADVLRAMGVVIMDDAGEFVGADKLVEQIRATVANGQNAEQTGAGGQEGQDYTEDEKGAQEAQGGGTEGENGKRAGEPELLTGHLDAAQLERMTKPDLIKLAEDMGVDISTAKNNAERAALLAAVPVQALKDDNGGAQ